MSDLLCPWCGGELPGEPGQFVKCRHCSSDIYWGDNKPWRTRMQAANASQVHPTEWSPAVEDAVPTPGESDFVPAESLPPPVPLLDKVDQQNRPLSWLERRHLKRQARKRAEAKAKRQIATSGDVDVVTWAIAYRSKIMPICILMLLLVYSFTALIAFTHGDRSRELIMVLLMLSSLLSLPLLVPLIIPIRKIDLDAFAPEITEASAPHEEYLDLSGLNIITPEVAEASAPHEEYLDLSGLNIITPEVAEALASHVGPLNVSGLTDITPEVAEALASHVGPLNVSGLTDIMPEVAEALASHVGPLNVSGLTDITPEVAETLAKHKGDSLNLSGLTNITLEVAEALVEHRGDNDAALDLRGLEFITPELAEVLANHLGSLCLARSVINAPDVDKAFANHKGVLFLAESKERNPNICSFACPNGHKISVPATLCGKRGSCSRCGTKVRIPDNNFFTGHP